MGSNAPRVGISFEDLTQGDDLSGAGPIVVVMETHWRTTLGTARCGIPAKQDQLTDNLGSVTCKKCKKGN